jgi:hypothetical protein
MKSFKYSSLIVLFLLICNFIFSISVYPQNPVDWTFRLNTHERVFNVDGQKVLDYLDPIIDSLLIEVETVLNNVDGWGPWTNAQNSDANFGSPISLNLDLDQSGILHFLITLNDVTAQVEYQCSLPGCSDITALFTAPIFEISGTIEPDTSAVNNLSVNAPGSSVSINNGSIPEFLEELILNSILSDLEAALRDQINTYLSTPGISELLAVLSVSNISIQDIILNIELDRFTGALLVDLTYEQPFTGALVNRDTPPVRGLMFSSSNILFTKQSMGFTGGNLTHYDNVYADDEQFFQLMDTLNIKFIRSEITWPSVEPFVDQTSNNDLRITGSASGGNRDYIDDYIATHAQVFDNLEVHYQLANQYLYDFVVTIGDGHSNPRESQSNKKLWVGFEDIVSQQDIDLGYNANDFVFITKNSYLNLLERHVRAVVRRLKNVIHFWQIENELNQADLAATTNQRDDFRRNGSAWAHMEFLDAVILKMSNSIKLEDQTAKITHNFHPFRLRKIQDWGQYLDVIGLTYHPNFLYAFPLMGYLAGDVVKIVHQLLGGTQKPVWILSSGYPAKENGNISDWDNNLDLMGNLQLFNTARQVEWVVNALSSSGHAQADAFLYRTYQAQKPTGPPSTQPNSYAGLVFPDGTPKASHDAIINELEMPDFIVHISGPQLIPSGQSSTFMADALGGVVEKINGELNYSFYRWYRKEIGLDWQEVSAGSDQKSLNQSGSNDFWLKCEVTDYYGFTKMSDEFLVQIEDPSDINIDVKINNIPKEISLIGNFPNPFNPSTTIRYGLNQPKDVSLKIYNGLGQVVRTLVNERQSAGYKNVVWDGKNDLGRQVPSGIYLYRLSVNTFVQIQKMILIR